MKRRTLTVVLDRYASLVSGPGARALLMEETNRAPVWISRQAAYSANEKTARSTIARAERLGYDIVITGPRAQQTLGAAAPSETMPEAEQLVDEGLFQW